MATRQEIAARATAASVKAARQRRFRRSAKEMRANPEDVEFDVQTALAEMLNDLDWVVYAP